MTHEQVKAWTKAHYLMPEREWLCLDLLWDMESGWRFSAHNTDRGGLAYGIPQAKPASKMASINKDWKVNPITQVKWGLKYIKTRYENHACWALRHEFKRGWY